MSRHLIVHQYCFQSSNSLWAVLHMPEERDREQRIHYVYTMSDCRPVQDDASQGATTSNYAWREDTPYSIVTDVLHVGVSGCEKRSDKLFDSSNAGHYRLFLAAAPRSDA